MSAERISRIRHAKEKRIPRRIERVPFPNDLAEAVADRAISDNTSLNELLVHTLQVTLHTIKSWSEEEQKAYLTQLSEDHAERWNEVTEHNYTMVYSPFREVDLALPESLGKEVRNYAKEQKMRVDVFIESVYHEAFKKDPQALVDNS